MINVFGGCIHGKYVKSRVKVEGDRLCVVIGNVEYSTRPSF